MKRLGSSDSLGALMSVCPPTADQEHSPRNNHMYSREFQSMLDGLEEEGCVEESSHALGEKKRRLSIDQVKALEKNFEVENKLEPERKVKLAQELGLQPRQVAVWFQNRRARWKTKQLERDYGVLKAKYDALKINYDALKHDNQALLKEIQELKSKLNEENAESNLSVKEEVNMPNDSDTNPVDDDESKPTLVTSETKELSFNGSVDGGGGGVCKVSIFADVTKDGSSDSDSSAILNEENSSSPHAAISSSATGQTHLATSSQQQSSSFMSCFQFQKVYQPLPQYVKMEEHNFFSGDEACNFFSDEQPPTLPWYCSDQWS